MPSGKVSPESREELVLDPRPGQGVRGNEVEAVGVHLDDGGAESSEPVDESRDETPALRGDAIGRLEIVPVAEARPEVAVERVDEDLEGLLERPEEPAIRLRPRLAGEPLRGHPELAEVAQHLPEDAQGVGGGHDPR